MEIYSNCLKQKGAHIGRVCGCLPELSGRNGSRTHEECNKNLKSTGKQVVSHFPLMLSMRPLNPISATGIFSFFFLFMGKKLGLPWGPDMCSPFRHNRYLNSQFLKKIYQTVQLRSAIHSWSPPPPPTEASSWAYWANAHPLGTLKRRYEKCRQSNQQMTWTALKKLVMVLSRLGV